MERFKNKSPFAVITQSQDPFSSVLKHPFVTINHIKIDFKSLLPLYATCVAMAEHISGSEDAFVAK